MAGEAFIGTSQLVTDADEFLFAPIYDFNHPLAGKTLNFDIKVLSVSPAKTN